MSSLIVTVLAVSFICYVNVAVAIQPDGVDGIQEGSIILDTVDILKQVAASIVIINCIKL